MICFSNVGAGPSSGDLNTEDLVVLLFNSLRRDRDLTLWVCWFLNFDLIPCDSIVRCNSGSSLKTWRKTNQDSGWDL